MVPAVMFQSSEATGQSPTLSMSLKRGCESRCSITPAGGSSTIDLHFRNNLSVSVFCQETDCGNNARLNARVRRPENLYRAGFGAPTP